MNIICSPLSTIITHVPAFLLRIKVFLTYSLMSCLFKELRNRGYHIPATSATTAIISVVYNLALNEQ